MSLHILRTLKKDRTFHRKKTRDTLLTEEDILNNYPINILLSEYLFIHPYFPACYITLDETKYYALESVKYFFKRYPEYLMKKKDM
jgi:hypothetical protein